MSDGRIDVSITVSPDVNAVVDGGRLRAAALAGLETVREMEEHPPIDLRSSQLEVSILVTDDTEMQRLNRAYRGVDRATDILSFSLVTDERGEVQVLATGVTQALGDIVISYPYAARQAEELGHSLEMELSWLVIHGALQLVGYSHHHDAEAEHMEALEHAALRKLGFSVP